MCTVGFWRIFSQKSLIHTRVCTLLIFSACKRFFKNTYQNPTAELYLSHYKRLARWDFVSKSHPKSHHPPTIANWNIEQFLLFTVLLSLPENYFTPPFSPPSQPPQYATIRNSTQHTPDTALIPTKPLRNTYPFTL